VTKRKLIEQRKAHATGGRYSCAILTKDELRQIIADFATCLERLDSFPAKCDIVELAKDGTFALHIMVYFPPPKRSEYSSRSEAIGNENSSTS
jgi:hypothetical protein